MNIKRDYKLRQKDEAKMSSLALENEKLLLAEDHPQFVPKYLEKIGIDCDKKTVGKGYIKLLWPDFIVEEITSSNRVISIDARDEEHYEEMNLEKPKTEADLVKQGMATFEVVERLAEVLNISINDISVAGLKDAKALTSQEISFNGLLPEDLKDVVIPNIFMKNIHQRKGIVERGRLNGNRFTIHVRVKDVDEKLMSETVSRINVDGFYNFYSLQRFGTRLLSHKIGELVLKMKYEEAVKMFLIGDSPHELKVFQNVRRNASQYWGNWQQMYEIFGFMPYFFYNELMALEALIKNDGSFTKALEAVADQTRMTVYAYFSYWYNRLLSYLINNNMQVPETLPLLRPRDEIKNMYKMVMKSEEIEAIRFHHPEMLFLNINRLSDVNTKVKPQIWSVYPSECGFVFNFDLDKGSYATTMLSEIFDLYQGKPVPEWVSQVKVDTKALIGQEAIELTELRFPSVNEDGLVELD